MNKINYIAKKIVLLCVCAVATMGQLAAQNALGCDGRRYLLDVFPTVDSVTVIYGQNVNSVGAQQVLKMDIYQPVGDVQTKRPVMVAAYGGGFVFGQRSDMAAFCRAFAKKGYVTVAIDYRLHSILLGFPDSVAIANAAVQATHDMKAAIRFLHKDAKTTNLYRIDSNNIIVGGISAGAITAIQAGILDSTDVIPTWIRSAVTRQGGFEGNSGNAGYTSPAKAIVSMSGGSFNTAAYDAGDPPMIALHGTADATVPYAYGRNVYGFYSYGDFNLYQQGRAIGVPVVLRTVQGGGHENLYDGTNAAFTAEFIQFLAQATVFCKQVICGETITLGNAEIEAQQNEVLKNLSIYPNPTQQELNVDLTKLPTESLAVGISLHDVTGRVLRHFTLEKGTKTLTIPRENLTSGLYWLRFDFEQGALPSVAKKIIWQ
jgi:predicted esterase